MKDLTESVFIPLFNNITQSIKKGRKYDGKGLHELLKNIEGAEILTSTHHSFNSWQNSSQFHVNQLEVGYYYILNSRDAWISVILPLMKKNNECSYILGIIFKTPNTKGETYWSNSPQTYINEKITKDSYWDSIILALKIPISISMYKFINWPLRNPMDVKE